MKVDNNGMPLFTLPKKAYNLKIKVDKDPNRRCNKTQVTIMAQALIPSKECFPVIQKTSGYFKLQTKQGRCVITGGETVTLGDGSQLSTSNFVVAQCNDTLQIQYVDNTL